MELRPKPQTSLPVVAGHSRQHSRNVVGGPRRPKEFCAVVSVARSKSVDSRGMTGPPEWPKSRITLVAWIISWIGEHGWKDCLRLITVMVVCALVLCGVLIVVHFVGS